MRILYDYNYFFLWAHPAIVKDFFNFLSKSSFNVLVCPHYYNYDNAHDFGIHIGSFFFKNKVLCGKLRKFSLRENAKVQN